MITIRPLVVIIITFVMLLRVAELERCAIKLVMIYAVCNLNMIMEAQRFHVHTLFIGIILTVVRGGIVLSRGGIVLGRGGRDVR